MGRILSDTLSADKEGGGETPGDTLTDQAPTVLVEDSSELCEVLRYCEMNVSEDPTKHTSLNRWFVLVLAQRGDRYFATICRKAGRNQYSAWFLAPTVQETDFESAAEKFIDSLQRYHKSLPWTDNTVHKYLPDS